MKVRERRPAELAAEPPPELREFDRAPYDDQRAGRDVYATREGWIAARRAWETAHGLTIMAWFETASNDLLDRFGLAGLGVAYAVYFAEDEDDEDPRVTA